MKSKFKIGDVVVINNPKAFWTTLYYRGQVHGEIGIVASITGSRIGVKHRCPPPRWLLVPHVIEHWSTVFNYTESELIKIGVL